MLDHSLYITRDGKLFHSPVNNIWQEKFAIQNSRRTSFRRFGCPFDAMRRT